MEIETLKKTQEKVIVFCTEEEKKKFWTDAVADFLDGNNRLHQRIDRMVDIKIDSTDKELLLDRIMQEDNFNDIKVVMNGLLVSGDKYYAQKLASYEVEMKDWGNRIAKKDETTDEKKMRLEAIRKEDGKANPVMKVYFNRFDFSLAHNPEWIEYYDKYSDFLLQGNQNKLHLKSALEKKWILDVTFTTYKSEIIRFNILEPFPKNKVGMKLPKPE